MTSSSPQLPIVSADDADSINKYTGDEEAELQQAQPIGSDNNNPSTLSSAGDNSTNNSSLFAKIKRNKDLIFRTFALLAGPLVASPFLFDILRPGHIEISRCAFVTIWMAIWWILEPVDLAVTSLLPFFLFPLIGITDAKVR